MIKIVCDGCGKEMRVGTKRDWVHRSEGMQDYCDECQKKSNQLMKWLEIFDAEHSMTRDEAYREKRRELFGY